MTIILNFIGLKTGGGLTEGINLIQTIPAVASERKFIAIVPAGYGYEDLDLLPNCELKIFKLGAFNLVWRLWFDNILLPRMARKIGAERVITLCNNGPLFARGFEHDILLQNAFLAHPLKDCPINSPQAYAKFLFLRAFLGISLRNASHVFVQSKAMKDQLRATYSVACPISITGRTIENLPDEATPQEANDFVRQKELLAKTSGVKALYLTYFYPHKNIVRAVEAFEARRALGDDIKLVLTFDDHNQMFESDAVVNIGPVNRAHISDIYKACDLVFCSSLIETIPGVVLEAFRYNKPLLISDLPYAREACLDAALYFNPYDPADIANSLDKLAADQALQKHLIKAGKAQYHRFNIDRETLAKTILRDAA